MSSSVTFPDLAQIAAGLLYRAVSDQVSNVSRNRSNAAAGRHLQDDGDLISSRDVHAQSVAGPVRQYLVCVNPSS